MLAAIDYGDAVREMDWIVSWIGLDKPHFRLD